VAHRRPQFVLPGQVDDRLEDLLKRTRADGSRASRSDIVAALIWHAPVDGDALGVMIRQYRREAQLVPSPDSIQRPPGPRPLVVGGP
jgi:hypothetical protein